MGSFSEAYIDPKGIKNTMRVSNLYPFFKVSEVVRETRQRRRPEGGKLKGCCIVFTEKLYLID